MPSTPDVDPGDPTGRDLYAALGVPSDASAREIAHAYRRLARVLHPDARPEDAAAEERFKAVSAAYAVLGDPQRRDLYDRRLRGGPPSEGSGIRVTVRRSSSAGGVAAPASPVRAGPVRVSPRSATPGRRPPAYQRNGADLLITVPLSYPEAVLGARVRLPDVSGRARTLVVPAGTRPGQRLRIRGAGVPTRLGLGDLIATIELVVPAELTEAERAAVEQLAAVTATSPRAGWTA